MAFFAVPDHFNGKTLKQIANEFSNAGLYYPRMDLVASALGVSENTPLRTGMSADINLDKGSGEFQFFAKNFTETTREALYAEQLAKAAQEQINKETAWVSKYLTDNPFVFDEELAKQSATAEYEPYYKELLNDYISDINVKRETVQDEKKLLGTLKQLDSGARTRAYQYAVENAEKGYEGKGLFGSGMRAREIGRQDIEYKLGGQEADARYGTQESSYNRTLAGYDTAEERKTRDINREQEVSVLGGIEQRRGEQLKPYLNTYEQSYKRQFQPSSMTATDYLPSSYLRY